MLALRLRIWVWSGTLFLALGCNVPPPAPTATAPGGDVSSASPAASAGGRIAIEDLPVVDPDPASLTAICDPDPSLLHPEADGTAIACYDAMMLGLRAASTVTVGPITRIYVRRQACAAGPCSTEELSTATVVAAAESGTVAVEVNGLLDSVSRPRAAAPAWPQPATLPAPSVEREDVGLAPAEVSNRTPYPYCGRTTYDLPQDVITCFRDSVLLGSHVEAIQVTFGTEGGEVLDIVRFDGAGALTRYRQAEGAWFRQRGGLILGIPGASWTFVPWDKGERAQ